MPLDGEAWPQKIELLLRESYAARFDDPERMVYLAELALAACEHLPGEANEPKLVDLQARVWAELANAYRLADFLDRAEIAIQAALDLYEQGSRDPLLLALISDRLATLLCHRRRFPESLALLDRLYSFYLSLGETHLAGRVLIKRGLYTENAGNPAEAIAITCKGLELLDASKDRSLVLAAAHNLLWCLTSLEDFQLAAAVLPKIRPLYGGDRLAALRLSWIEARVASGLGDEDSAERLYKEVRTGFLAAGVIFPASLASLELAQLWISQGKVDATRDLVAEILTSFRALRIGREAIAALVLLRRACEGESLTAEIESRLRLATQAIKNLQSRSN